MTQYIFRCQECGELVESKYRDPWPQHEANPVPLKSCEGTLKRVYTAPNITTPSSGWGH